MKSGENAYLLLPLPLHLQPSPDQLCPLVNLELLLDGKIGNPKCRPLLLPHLLIDGLGRQ